MFAQTLMIISAAIIGLLGSAHLLLTFNGPKLSPRDPAVKSQMEQAELVITTQTTMWRAWLGFNASHSLGAILFALIFGFLATAHADLLFQSKPLLVIGFLTLAAFVFLAKTYWFSTPLMGTSVALLCYVGSIAVAWS